MSTVKSVFASIDVAECVHVHAMVFLVTACAYYASLSIDTHAHTHTHTYAGILALVYVH